MSNHVKTYSLRPPTAETSLRPSSVHVESQTAAVPHPIFQRFMGAQFVEDDSRHRQRFNSLLNAAAQQRPQGD